MTTLAPESPAWLADLYHPEDLEAWRLLARHFELTEGFSFVVFLAPDDWAVQFLRSQLPRLLGSDEAVRRVRFDPDSGEGALAESLLSLAPLPLTVRCVWIDADPVTPEMFAARDKAWSAALSRLNRYRNTLQSRFTCTLILALPIDVEPILRSAAPDLYSIRSAVLRAEPRRPVPLEWLSPADPWRQKESSEAEETGDPAATLAEADKLRGKPGRETLLAELLLRAGRQALSRRQCELSVKSLEEAYELEKQHGGFPDLRFRIALSLAAVFTEMARYDRARFYAEQGLEVAHSHFGQDDPRTAIALNQMGTLLLKTNDPLRAEPLMRRALAVDEAIFGLADPEVATDLNNLAELLKSTNRVADAEPLLRRALAIYTTSFGPEHPLVAVTLNNLAHLLLATNRLAEAEPLMRRALAIDEASLGPGHPDLAIRLNNLAHLLQTTNRLAEAELLMRRNLLTLQQFSKATRHPHPNLAVATRNYSAMLKNMGRSDAEISASLDALRREARAAPSSIEA